VGGLLGAGAMGRVHVGVHVELGRPCAVKVIAGPPDGDGPASQVDAAARFRVEAIAASRLDHPNVLRVLDFGCEPDGLAWLVTELLEGEDLVDVVASGTAMPTPRVVSIGRQLAAALQHAHERGVVHRDVKPENVRLVRRDGDDGRELEVVKLVDFGTAYVEQHGDVEGARADEVVGTPAYMSPEQITGRPVDGRTDVYACGVLLFEMATGRLPFVASRPYDLARAHLDQVAPSARAIHPGVDPDLAAVIAWCLRKRADERPRSARELHDALAAIDARTRVCARSPELADTARLARASLPSAPLLLTRRASRPVAAPRPPAPEPAPTRTRWAGSAALALFAAVVLGGAAWAVVAETPPAGVDPLGARRADAPTPLARASAAGAAPERATTAAPDAGAAPPTASPAAASAAPAPQRTTSRHAAEASRRPPPARAPRAPAPDDDDPYAAAPPPAAAPARLP
jgi:serine/threonine-protein kinase